jgi:hypothetical protein
MPPAHHPVVEFAPGAGLRLPVVLRRTLTRLTAQQFWLFGCDVRRPEGNVLAELGFRKQKAPGTGPAPSRYHLVVPGGETIVLWGFGLLWTDPDGHGVFLPRHRFQPRYRPGGEPVPPAWSEPELDGLHLPAHADCPRCGAMVLAAIDWLIAYEHHIRSCRGLAYRDETMAAWSRPIGTAADLPTRWQQARSHLAASITPI